MAAGAGIGRDGPAEAGAGRRITALVKWFMPTKGYGFLEPVDGSADVFCHVSAVEACGRETLPQGAVVTCEIVSGDRGPQVSRILSVDPPPTGHGAAERSQPFDNGYPGPQPGAAASAVLLRATVKFFDPARGFGFVVPDAGGREVFVHSSVLFRSGMTDLEPGQRVLVRAESVPRGLQASGDRAALSRPRIGAGAALEKRMNEPDAPQSASAEEEARIAETPADLREQGFRFAQAGRREDHIRRGPAGIRRGRGVAAHGGVPAARRSRRPAPAARLDRRRRRDAARALRGIDALSRQEAAAPTAPPPNDVIRNDAADWTIGQLREPAQRIADRIEALMNGGVPVVETP